MNAVSIAAKTKKTKAEKRVTLACGDCAGEILAAGGKRAKLASLSYGAVCTVHPPDRLDMPATNAIHLPKGWKRAKSEQSAPSAPAEPLSPRLVAIGAIGAGPVTEIAARLVTAWTSGEEGMKQLVDIGLVPRAVRIATEILELTKGA
jgi:hypothetical protein